MIYLMTMYYVSLIKFSDVPRSSYLPRIQDYFRETGFQTYIFFVEIHRQWTARYLLGSRRRESYDNHPSVMSLTVVVIFRINAVYVVSVACQGGWTPLTRQRTSCGNEKGRVGPRGLNQTSLNFLAISLPENLRRLKQIHDTVLIQLST